MTNVGKNICRCTICVPFSVVTIGRIRDYPGVLITSIYPQLPPDLLRIKTDL
jgi:hypothetical protein